ncbi:hypothetical protein C8F01DRAFT_1133839 [Mycena amicta]|nr:hypothetical protein C8F01DRAFT_1133839 [Mycena amicta]
MSDLEYGSPTFTPISLAQAYLNILQTGGPAELAPLLSEDFTWKIIPECLGALPRNKRDYLLQLADLGNLFKSITFSKPLDAIEAADSVVLHVIGEGQLAATHDSFVCDYIFVVRCTQDGKLRSVTEFLDTEVARKLWSAGDGAGFKLVQTVY